MAQDLIINGVLQGDLDCAGHKLLNVDISNLTPPVTFGPVAAHTVFAGPLTGTAVPVFRLLTASEVGAQSHSDALDTLSNTAPSNTGIALLEIADTLQPGYPHATGSDTAPFATLFTPAQVRSDINAQLHHATLDTLSTVVPTVAGLNFLIAFSPAGGYPKVGPLPGSLVTIQTGQQTADDLSPLISPFTDSKPHVKNSSVPTKLFRIDCSGITAAGATRVMTVPDYDFVPASISVQESLINKVINGMTVRVGTATGDDLTINYTQTPAQPIQFSIIDLSGTSTFLGVNLVFRVTGAVADLVVRDGGTITTETSAPLTPTSIGSPGATAYDATYEYRCTGVNQWKRIPYAAWP